MGGLELCEFPTTHGQTLCWLSGAMPSARPNNLVGESPITETGATVVTEAPVRVPGASHDVYSSASSLRR